MGHHTQQRPRIFRTEVVPVQAGGEILDPRSAELGFQFINHLHRPVTVVTRTGFRIVIPHSGPPRFQTLKDKRRVPGDPYFIIRTRLTAQPEVILDTSELSNDAGHQSTIESQAYLNSVVIMENARRLGPSHTACVEYRIPAEDFDSNGGVLHLQNIDLLVSILDQATTPPHPYSLLGVRNRDADEFQQEQEKVGVFYGVYIRDKDGGFGQRYLNINGEVFGVPVRNEPSDERDGVYRVCNGKANSGYIHRRTIVEYYNFEEADEKLGLYQTYRDAFALGNPQEKSKRDYEERSQQLKLDELEYRNQKAASEARVDAEKERMRMEMLHFEQQQRKIDHLNRMIGAELDRRDQHHRREMQVLKEILEARGHERREAGELIKLIPSVVTTVALYVAAIKKLKSL
ncbi:hypothetical protein LUCX_286 [Xanthomonas phage vB_XciM_LucasX]|nr:hypothetical protein LUCX_286 [Xanthomonas phage vB_XciM_LucasX]